MDETEQLENAGSNPNESSEEAVGSAEEESAGPKGEDPQKRDNQHYISKAYLDKFIHPASSQKVLYPYAKGSGPQSPRGTKRLASADHFYRQIDAGKLTNKLDEARKESETLFFASGKRTAGPLAKCVFDDSYMPAASDKIMLAGAAAFLRSGAPVQIHNTAMIGLLCTQMELFNKLNTDETKRKYKEKYGDEADEMLYEHREALWKGNVLIDVGRENWKQLGFESFKTEALFLNGLMRMGLTVCASHPKSFFITSDNPVILVSPFQKDSPGLGHKDTQVWFPISYKKGLMWSWKHSGIDRTTFGHSATRALNRAMIKWCYREIYSPLPEDWIAAAVKENTFDPCYGHYGSLEQMAGDFSFDAVDDNGRKREIVDLLAALRAGEKTDVLNLHRQRSCSAK